MIKNAVKGIINTLGRTSKPDFIIIGVQKGGTSALYSILKDHSRLIASTKKEVHYFDNDAWYKQGNINDYHRHFKVPFWKSKQCLSFEATPIYIYHPDVARRLYAYNPNLKLILMLRDPAQRALSAWTMYHHHFQAGPHQDIHEPRSFKDVIEEEINNINSVDYYSSKRGIVKRGIYLYQIQEYLKYFSTDQLLILESGQLKKDFDNQYARITRFLDIPKEHQELKLMNKSKINNKSAYGDELTLLREFYRPHNTALYDFIGEQYNW